jgi:hypothetical protein
MAPRMDALADTILSAKEPRIGRGRVMDNIVDATGAVRNGDRKEIERLLSVDSAGDSEAQLERFLRSMYGFHADKVEIRHLLIVSKGGEDEIFEKVRNLLLEFIRTGVKRERFSVARLEATVDFLLTGLHGLLVTYLHEGRSAKRFTGDAMSLTRPLLGL